jgi:hypothetical protein
MNQRPQILNFSKALASWAFHYDEDGRFVKQVYTDGTTSLNTILLFSATQRSASRWGKYHAGVL